GSAGARTSTGSAEQIAASGGPKVPHEVVPAPLVVLGLLLVAERSRRGLLERPDPVVEDPHEELELVRLEPDGRNPLDREQPLYLGRQVGHRATLRQWRPHRAAPRLAQDADRSLRR